MQMNVVLHVQAGASCSSSSIPIDIKDEDNDQPRVRKGCLAPPIPGVESDFYRCLSTKVCEACGQPWPGSSGDANLSKPSPNAGMFVYDTDVL